MPSDNPFDQPLNSESSPQSAPSDNPFDQPFSSEGTTAKPSGLSGFIQGAYDNTVGPIKQLAGETRDYVSHLVTPEGRAESQQMATASDDFKRQTYREAGEHLKNGQFAAAAGTLLSLLGDAPEDKTDPLNKMVIGLIAAHKAEAAKAVAAAKQGRYSEAVGHGVAAALPAVGPAAAKAGEDIGNGDVAYGAGEATGLIGSVLAPEIAGKAMGKAAEVATPEVADLPGGETMPVRGKVSDAIAGPKAQDTFDRQVQNPAARKGVANLAAEVADSGDTAKAVPPVEDPLGIRQASEAPKARAKAGFQVVDEATNNALSQAQQDALDASDDFTVEGKKSFREANQKVEDLINQHADKLPDGTTAQSLKDDWRKYVNLQKVAKSFDTAYRSSPEAADAGYVDGAVLRSKIADLRQNGVLKAAGFSGNHIQTLDEIGVRMQQAGERIRIGKVATGLAADIGVHTIGTVATAKLALPAMALRFLVGKAVLNPDVAGTLLRGLKAGYAPTVISGQVARAMAVGGAPKPPVLQTVLAGEQ